jgi:mono/diheme cytochrome c family protein
MNVVRLAACVSIATLLFACARTASDTTTTTSSATTAPGAAPASTRAASASAGTVAAAGDAAHGKAIFSSNCASCHGASGTEGGVGPSLKNEKSRKDQAAAVAWIKNPAPPMPKLYPSPLSDKDVTDVASYVESL